MGPLWIEPAGGAAPVPVLLSVVVECAILQTLSSEFSGAAMCMLCVVMFARAGYAYYCVKSMVALRATTVRTTRYDEYCCTVLYCCTVFATSTSHSNGT